MNYHPLVILTLLAGSVISLIGVALVVMNIVQVQHANRIKSIVEGVAYVLFGAFMLWFGILGLQGIKDVDIDFGISPEQFSAFFLVFVASLFIIRAIQGFRNDAKRLEDKKLSPVLVFANKLHMVFTIIFIVFLVLALGSLLLR